jgi:GTP-binding protein
MFVDEVSLKVVGGHGGNGMVTFRREKYVPFGGPDGGNGGNGGDVIFQSENNVDTLSDFRSRKVFKAPDGVNGGRQKLTGKNASPLILNVPVGTIVTDKKTKEVLADFTRAGEQCVIAKGGRGGYGNAHFVSSVRQAPKFAELGDRGEEKEITLVLKLVADVGIIGLPNAGKSTLISILSAAKPAIANYPFTTLIPNLGIVHHKGKSFVISDNPGLIEGASKGKGLGIEFLKHIERTRILLHLIDGFEGDPVKAYTTITKELKKYNKALAEKKQLVVINKCDVLYAESIESIRKQFAKKKVTDLFFISAATGENIDTLLDAIIRLLQTLPKQESALPKSSVKIFRPHLDDPHYFEVKKKKNTFVITGKRIEQIVRMSPQGNKEALQRVYDVLLKMGIYKELIRQGAQDGQKIIIGDAEILFRA